MILNSKFIIHNSKKGFTLIRTRLCRNLVNVQAFTLIELLVVIAIIGVLATLIMANFVGVRERARDAQRKSEINQIQKALEIYKNSQTTPAYPAAGIASLRTALQTNYMQVVPRDPSYNATSNPDADYIYVRDPDAPTDLLRYKLVACLENASDQQKDTAKDASCTTASITRYNP